jgi:hypothetical protein
MISSEIGGEDHERGTAGILSSCFGTRNAESLRNSMILNISKESESLHEDRPMDKFY